MTQLTGQRCCGRNVFLDEITGVNPVSTCPPFTTASSVDDLPTDGSYTLGLVQTERGGVWIVFWGVWDGENWIQTINVDFTITDGEFTEFTYEVLAGWSITILGVTYTEGTDTVVIDPHLTLIEGTVITNVESGCVYQVGSIEVPITCYWAVAFSAPDFPSDPFESWTIDGGDLFIYLNNNLPPGAGYYHQQGATIDGKEWLFVYFNLPQGETPPAWVVRDEDDEIVDYSWTNYSCGVTPTGCATAEVTMPNQNDTIESTIIMDFNLGLGGIQPLLDPSGAEDVIAATIDQVFELTAIVTITITGALTFTITIDGVPDFTQIKVFGGNAYDADPCT